MRTPMREAAPPLAQKSGPAFAPDTAHRRIGITESSTRNTTTGSPHSTARLLLRLADAVTVILAASMIGALLYAAALVSGTLLALGLVLGALGFGGLALVAMLGEIKS